MTYEEFADEHGITMTCKQIPRPKGREDWPTGSTHWRCRLVRQSGPRKKRSMNVTYSMGSAHKGDPVLADVLGSIAMDARIWESATGDYDMFLDEFGYEDDKSHRATWRAVEKERDDLKNFLDGDLYDELINETEEG